VAAARIWHYDSLKHRVVILGTCHQAERIATRLRRRTDQRGFTIHSFLRIDGGEDRVSPHGVAVTRTQEPLIEYCKAIASRKAAATIPAVMAHRWTSCSTASFTG